MPSFDRMLVARREHVRRAAIPETASAAATRSTPTRLPEHTLVMPLGLVMVDEQPVDSDGSYHDPWDSLPEPFRSALTALVTARPGDPAARCWVCGSSAVGWTDEHDERGWRWTWQLTGLLWSPSMPEDGPVISCEGCSPTILDAPIPDMPL